MARSTGSAHALPLLARPFRGWSRRLLILSLSLAGARIAPAADPGSSAPSVEQRSALEVVSRRMVYRWTEGSAALAGDARRDAAALRADGSWPDVDYADPSRSIWRTVRHLQRARSIAAVGRGRSPELEGGPELRKAALRALEHWIDRDFQNSNWWWNQIGVPMYLGPTLLLLGEEVPPELRARGARILARAKLGGGTGQNLVWLTEMALIRGCVEERPEVVAAAFARIAEEVRVTTGEGIQPDFSFHQHGPQLYSGGYGFGFSADVPRLAALAAGTPFRFPGERIEVIARYLLDGQQWIVRGGTFDHAAVGREITRRGLDRRGPALERAVRDLLLVDPPRADELGSFADRLRDGGAIEDQPSGHRHFWRSDFSVHRRPEFSTSVKMSSTRTLGWEIVNSEGLRSHHTADGMSLLYRRGDEYQEIFGAWDWLAIPGTTVLQTPRSFEARGARGATSFAGGASDGSYGVTALDLAKGPLQARKSWFFFDGEYVCLGAGIRCDDPEPVVTTLNQCLLRGEVTRSPPDGEGHGRGLTWIHHDGVGYVVRGEDQASLRIEAGPREGSWHDINSSYPAEPFRRSVFRVAIDHGSRPAGARYAYAVVPGIEAAGLGGYRWPVEVLANEPEVQGVRHLDTGILAAVFYRPGRIDVPGRGPLEATEPCVVLVREQGDDAIVAASSPEHRELALVLTVPLRIRGDGAETIASGGTRLELALPGGPLAGSSVVRRLRRDR